MRSSEIAVRMTKVAMRMSEEVLKGLSHEMDLTFDDMYGYWLVIGLDRGCGRFLSLF